MYKIVFFICIVTSLSDSCWGPLSQFSFLRFACFSSTALILSVSRKIDLMALGGHV